MFGSKDADSVDARRRDLAVVCGPGRITCLPANPRGGHWALYIVDQNRTPPEVLVADSCGGAALPERAAAFLRRVPGLEKFVVRSARAPLQLVVAGEMENCGMHLLQNLEFIARHRGDRPLDDLRGAFRADNVPASMSARRAALGELLEELVDCGAARGVAAARCREKWLATARLCLYVPDAAAASAPAPAPEPESEPTAKRKPKPKPNAETTGKRG